MNLAMLSVLVLAIPLVSGGEVRGVYLAFLALVVLGSFEAVQPLGTAFQFLGRSVGAGERLFEIVDAEPEVKDPADTTPCTPGPQTRARRGGLPLRGRRPVRPRRRLVRPGAGQTGRDRRPQRGGEEHARRPRPALLGPDEGEISIGGHDVRGYAQDDVRALIGVVSQDTHVFNDTLRANLLLARPEATDDDLRNVLARAQLDELVERLPRGLESPLGEQGLKLSGGERQRLSVARALLKDAPLLVLDEPTANLDPATERELLDAVYRSMQDRATLVITHRLVRMEEMDEILVLDAGKDRRARHARGTRKQTGDVPSHARRTARDSGAV